MNGLTNHLLSISSSIQFERLYKMKNTELPHTPANEQKYYKSLVAVHTASVALLDFGLSNMTLLQLLDVLQKALDKVPVLVKQDAYKKYRL